MNYNIKGTELSITPEIRGYVEKKLSALDKYIFDTSAARADVELEFKVGEARMYRAEMMLHIPKLGEPLRAEAVGGGLHEAIDIAVGDLTNELTRAKKKRLHVLREGAGKVKDFIRGFRKKV